jgi:hypothetical protein
LKSSAGQRQGEDRPGEREARTPGLGRLGAVDQQHGMRIEALEHAGGGNAHQRVVGHDGEIRIADVAALVDRPAVGANEGKHRRAAPLGAIARRVLHREALAEEGGAEHAARRLHALAAAAVKADAEHAHLYRPASRPAP